MNTVTSQSKSDADVLRLGEVQGILIGLDKLQVLH
jgi:hypothetical protein